MTSPLRSAAPVSFATCRAEMEDPSLPLRLKLRQHLRWQVLNVLGRAVRPFRRPRPGELRIVMYHAVFPDELAGFQSHLRYFRDHFRVLPLSSALEALEHGRGDEPLLAITFDDGFEDNFSQAAPALEELGMRATFFMPGQPLRLAEDDTAGLLDFSRERLRLGRPMRHLSAAQLRELRARGHEIGSHSMSHRPMSSLSLLEAEEELAASKQQLEQVLGEPIHYFAWPFGFLKDFSPALVEAAERVGYRKTLSASRGPNRPGAPLPWLLREHLDPFWPLAHVRYFLER
ncbi:MAG TPA: polysaccharide deacetylase family protein, partial [Myxococcaceae bacterium]|nr:polysaccharide deacetylase family protein [Myxococcaceae bacterium]